MTSAQIQELKNNGEQNKNIVDLADKLNNLSKSQSYDQVLKDHVEWAFSDDAQEQEAFRSLWGTLIALDGGVSDEYLNGDSQEKTDLVQAVEDALKLHNGSVTNEDIADFFDTHGK